MPRNYKPKNCIDCGTPILQRSTRCRPCNEKHRISRRGEGPNPGGVCLCGCNQPAPIAQLSNTRNGTVAGKPQKFILGHTLVKNGGAPEYLEEDRGYDTPCWVWQRNITNKGYASPHKHQDYYINANGPIPKYHSIHHLCEVKCCVNPDHLIAMPKGKHSALHATKHADDKIRFIRSMRGVMTCKQVGEIVGAHPDYVSKVMRGVERKNVI